MGSGKSIIGILALIISSITLLLVIYVVLAGGDRSGTVDFAERQNLAGELVDNNLYQAAIDEYLSILNDSNLETGQKANINYIIGRIYFENINDYEKAAAFYIKARSLNPNGSFYDEAGRNLIACMEKMGRILDAKRELDKTVNIDSVYAEHEGETVVAKIGDKPVYMSDVEDNIQNLPPQMQKEFLSRESRMEALNGYIGIELIYRAAVREGFNSNPELIKLTERLAKQAVVDRYLKDKVMTNVAIDDNDVQNFYQANKSAKYGDKEFGEVKEQVSRDYQNEKFQQVFQNYVNKLAAVENVQVFEEKIK